MVNTRSTTRDAKAFGTSKHKFDENKKRNKIAKKPIDVAAKSPSENKTVSELLKKCRPLHVKLTRCDVMSMNSSKWVEFEVLIRINFVEVVL